MYDFWQGKSENDFGARNCSFHTFCFWSLSRDISLWGEPILFWALSYDIPIYGNSCVLAKSVQKLVVICFPDSLVRKTTQKSNDSGIIKSDSQILCKEFKKNLFISVNTYQNYIVSKKYWITLHDVELCLLPNCSYHILLLGKVEEWLHKLDQLRLTYQHIDCLYTFFKYRFSGIIVVKSGQVFDNVKKAV